jgi:hypothetical protein
MGYDAESAAQTGAVRRVAEEKPAMLERAEVAAR